MKKSLMILLVVLMVLTAVFGVNAQVESFPVEAPITDETDQVPAAEGNEAPADAMAADAAPEVPAVDLSADVDDVQEEPVVNTPAEPELDPEVISEEVLEEPEENVIVVFDVIVRIEGEHNSAEYDGKYHTVSGYRIVEIDCGDENDYVNGAARCRLFKEEDLVFEGKANAARQDPGITMMGLKADMFTNKKDGIAAVTFEITDGYQEITEKKSEPKEEDELPEEPAETDEPDLVIEEPPDNGPAPILIIHTELPEEDPAEGEEPAEDPAEDLFNEEPGHEFDIEFTVPDDLPGEDEPAAELPAEEPEDEPAEDEELPAEDANVNPSNDVLSEEPAEDPAEGEEPAEEPAPMLVINNDAEEPAEDVAEGVEPAVESAEAEALPGEEDANVIPSDDVLSEEPAEVLAEEEKPAEEPAEQPAEDEEEIEEDLNVISSDDVLTEEPAEEPAEGAEDPILVIDTGAAEEAEEPAEGEELPEEEPAEEESAVALAKAETNIRINADGMSEILLTLDEDTELVIIGIEGDWVKVELEDGTIGFIHNLDIELPAEESAEEPAEDEEPSDEPTEPAEAAKPAEEPEEEATKAETPKKVTIFTSRRTQMELGEEITLTSLLEGFEECSAIKYQWECDKGDGFEPVEGANGDSYSYPATLESISWSWRLMVYYK